MDRTKLVKQITKKKSYLCIGLDTDLETIPKHLGGSADPVFEFNRAIIDKTKDYCVSYKLNLAFYEQNGAKGWESLEKTIEYIPEDIFIIADAKRGDIGNSAEKYAKAFFEHLDVDAVTLSPYMGEDSIQPFLNYPGKWAILLGLTSNRGSFDFQMLELGTEQVYQNVIKKARDWGNPSNMMFVIGATHPELFKEIRTIIPEHFMLVPGIGAQGGSLAEVSENGMISDCGLLVNSSRAIIYASQGEYFAEQAALQAKAIKEKMQQFLQVAI